MTSGNQTFSEMLAETLAGCCAPEPASQPEAGCCAPGVAARLSDEMASKAADLFKALADPARLQILDILSQRAGEVCVCDLEGKVGLPDERGQRPKQPTVSHHLKVLRDAGLIDCEKRGIWAFYFLRREQLAQVQAFLNAFSSAVQGQAEQAASSTSAVAVRGQT
jgi:ArsR family transcriptional regulator, arsenate/arsenite/antimonite-responsive transcriptional repressor